MKTLIAVDTNDEAHYLSEVAMRLFPGAEHTVLSVASLAPAMITEPFAGGSMAVVPGVRAMEAAENAADSAVEEASAALDGATAEVTTSVMIGDPGQAICEQAEVNDVDVVIVGRRSKGWLSRLFDPSVSDYVVHHSSRPVLVVSEPETS